MESAIAQMWGIRERSVSSKAVAPGCFNIVMNLWVDEIGAYSFLLLTITKHLHVFDFVPYSVKWIKQLLKLSFNVYVDQTEKGDYTP